MDLTKANMNVSGEGDEEDNRLNFGRAVPKMAKVFRTPEYSKNDTTDALAVPPQQPKGNLFRTAVQPPAKSCADEEVLKSNLTTSEPGPPQKTSAVQNTIEDDEHDRYNMQHKRRGVALIFNHKHFEDSDLKSREGADQDGAALQEVLRNLAFDVRYFVDLTVTVLKKTLRDVSMEDHQDADCLFVAVMTHGEKGDMLHAKDNPFKVDDVWHPFTADRALSLAGKPKIFLIQACRGRKVDNPIWKSDATDSMPSESLFSIPTRADFLFAHSTPEGFYSWRNPDTGSWFVQDFCKEMAENGRRKDLLTIMTLTLKRVALSRMSCAPNRQDLHRKKQMPVFTSTLTKLVYFDSTAV